MGRLLKHDCLCQLVCVWEAKKELLLGWSSNRGRKNGNQSVCGFWDGGSVASGNNDQQRGTLGDEARIAFASRWVSKWSPSKVIAIVRGVGFAIKQHKHGACDVCMTTPSDATRCDVMSRGAVWIRVVCRLQVTQRNVT